MKFEYQMWCVIVVTISNYCVINYVNLPVRERTLIDRLSHFNFYVSVARMLELTSDELNICEAVLRPEALRGRFFVFVTAVVRHCLHATLATHLMADDEDAKDNKDANCLSRLRVVCLSVYL